MDKDDRFVVLREALRRGTTLDNQRRDRGTGPRTLYQELLRQRSLRNRALDDRISPMIQRQVGGAQGARSPESIRCDDQETEQANRNVTTLRRAFHKSSVCIQTSFQARMECSCRSLAGPFCSEQMYESRMKSESGASHGTRM